MMAPSDDGNESSKEEEKEDIPPWERREMEKKLSKDQEFPWPVFLLGSLITLSCRDGERVRVDVFRNQFSASWTLRAGCTNQY